MNAAAAVAPAGPLADLATEGGFTSLAALSPGARGRVVGVGATGTPLSALERRLLELGFVPGEHIEILTEARPGRDPFVVRVGHTTLALRRREAELRRGDGHRRGSVHGCCSSTRSPAMLLTL